MELFLLVQGRFIFWLNSNLFFPRHDLSETSSRVRYLCSVKTIEKKTDAKETTGYSYSKKFVTGLRIRGSL